VFAHTSRWEGFGLVLLEAMLAGVPVVATRVSAVPEIVADGETGRLVAPGDVGAVAEQLSQLLADSALRERLGTAGQARARSQFSVEQMAKRTISVYEAAVR
jgi:glycosyltransferase involved in cell wall biosynthesis